MNPIIITYHYIRDHNPFNVHSLTNETFKAQVDYFLSNHEAIFPPDLLHAVENNLPAPRGFLPTFDDGLKEHYSTAYPLLKAQGISGIFFPNISHLIDGSIPVVNQLQVLIGGLELAVLETEILKRYALNPHGKKLEFIPEANRKIKRFDNDKIQNLKFFVNFCMPDHVRMEVLGGIFRELVGDVERYAAENFLTRDEIKEMSAGGMYFGAHTHTHQYLTSLSRKQKEYEIAMSIQFLDDLLGCQTRYFCYPFGHSDSESEQILRASHVGLAFTTKPNINTSPEYQFRIGRYDAIHCPPISAEPDFLKLVKANG